MAEHLLHHWLLPRFEDQRQKICKRLNIEPTAPIDPKYQRMSCSLDGCDPLLFAVQRMVEAGLHKPKFIHWLKLVAGGTGIVGLGQENDRSPVFRDFKHDGLCVHVMCICVPRVSVLYERARVHVSCVHMLAYDVCHARTSTTYVHSS